MAAIVASSPGRGRHDAEVAHFCTRAAAPHRIGAPKAALSIHARGVWADSICITTLAVQDTMNSSKPFASAPRRRLFDAGIEWEELPSLADSLAKRLAHAGVRNSDFQNSSTFNSVWDATMPAALDPLQESGPFVESVRGLVTRELREPDVFRHFFA
jgi:hypothetical protein